MTADEKIVHSLALLRKYMEEEEFKGYDPYDGLNAPIFRWPVLRRQHTLLFLIQQGIKRSPINLRKPLGIKKSINPVTLGLAIQGYAQSSSPGTVARDLEKINHLLDELKRLIPPGYQGACWGYDFPWEARYASIPAYQPTIVATGIICNALYLAWKKLNIPEAASLIEACGQFIIRHINRSVEQDQSFCFSYSPFDHEKVFNASMKGARMLSQAYVITKNEAWRTLAAQAVDWVMKYQRADGAWVYSQRKTGDWIDNYHTGYILDCLDDFGKCTGLTQWNPALEKGLHFYLSNFIGPQGQARFYDQQEWPLDCTAAGQCLLTLSRFNRLEEAKRVALYTIENMQDSKGYFYFRKYPKHTNKANFMRWSNAWMLAGLSSIPTETSA
ncbi:MAG: delta-aminolevulinic acid dehydratase [Bacteroidia bacterium]|nr:delta-aminolevulinic acid dehydratase [Bacteroidia bacterium]